MKPDTCHCCEPPTGGTPVVIDNRPGLSAVAYRVGTFANFRQSMFQAISRSAALRDLSTRQSDDYSNSGRALPTSSLSIRNGLPTRPSCEQPDGATRCSGWQE